MKRVLERIRSFFSKVAQDQEKAAQQTIMEELFNDIYKNRHRIYKVNFFRGVFFGLGSVLGGTIVLAALVWILSLFVNFPVIGQFFEETQSKLQDTSQPQ